MKPVIRYIISLFAIDFRALVRDIVSLADIIIAVLISGLLLYHFGVTFKMALVIAVISAVLLVRAKRRWQRQFGHSKQTIPVLPLSLSIRLLATVLLMVIAVFMLVHGLFLL